MSYRNEAQMYPDVVAWLSQLLSDRYRSSHIDVRDTHSSPLNEYIEHHQLQRYFRSRLWQTFDIRVDVAGFIERRNDMGIVFVECKIGRISLQHLSQLLGYSRIAQPLLSYLISPIGIGDVVRSLILTYDRTDILEYHWEPGREARSIRVARFDPVTKQLDSSSVLPPGVI